jgi:hypothetical protein
MSSERTQISVPSSRSTGSQPIAIACFQCARATSPARNIPNHPRTARDRLYAELRNITEQADKLGHRARLAATSLATLPVRNDDDAEIG